MSAVDMLGNPLAPGDFVVFTNNIYEVLEIPVCTHPWGFAYVKIILVNPSKTTRPVRKYSSDFCLLAKEDVIAWLATERDKSDE